MFELSLPSAESLKHVDDAAVVAAIAECARVEAAAAAHRLAATAELVARRADGPTDMAGWSCDNWDAMAAEVAAAQNISHGMASGQMYLATALRDRLPAVAALFADGIISARLASSIVWHTDLITDPDTMQLIDQSLAGHVTKFGPLSATKTALAIDAIVDRYDPEAVRRARASARGRDVVIAAADDRSGTAHLWGSLLATDAAVLDRRLTQMAHQVCEDDPRTIAQRRADALGTLAAGGEQLTCACATPGCPARVDADPRATAVVIHVVAETSSLAATPDPHTSGEPARRPTTPDTPLREALAPDPEPPSVRLPSAWLPGGGPVPAPRLAELIAGGATVLPLRHPGDSPPESGYRPSAQLQRFIRCRDLTCRFPGCDRPAECCDVDHTVPYPLGPTHPSNLKCLCGSPDEHRHRCWSRGYSRRNLYLREREVPHDCPPAWPGRMARYALFDWMVGRMVAVPVLADSVLPLIRTRRTDLYRWDVSNEHGSRMHEAVDALEEAAATATDAPEVREVCSVTHKALAAAIKVIARADDSSGIIGDACRRLLGLHPQVAARAGVPAGQLVEWMMKFQFDGEVDYFELDPVAYAPALGDKGLAAYRARLDETRARLGPEPDERWSSPHSHEWFVLQWNAQRLAVLDRDIDAIIRTHAKDRKVAACFEDTARAFEEIGEIDLAIDWAKHATDFGPGHQSLKAARYWCELLDEHRPTELVDARVELFRRWPSSSTAAALYQDAGDAWPTYRDTVLTTLSHSPRDAVLFVLGHLDDVRQAWELAHTLHLDGADVWEQLAKAYQKTDPAAVLPVYRRLVENELTATGVRHYQAAARRLKIMRRLAATDNDSTVEVDTFVADLREQHRRRPGLQREFDRAGLP